MNDQVEEEEELIPVDTPIENENEDEDDERVDKTNDSDEDDERVDKTIDGETREEIQARRRQEKKDRKKRQDAAKKRDKTELTFLRQQNDELEKRLVNIEQVGHQNTLTQFDTELQQAEHDVNTANQIISKAIEAGAGDDVTQAMTYRDDAILRAEKLRESKKQAAVKPSVKKVVDPAIRTFANEFIEDHEWYNAKGSDEASSIVKALDKTLASEGFDPRTGEYWDTLRERVKNRLPEKFKEERQQRGGPNMGSGRQHAPSTTRREVYISPERKEALIEAGVWDDPVLRQRYIKKYMEYDKNHRN